MKINWGLLNELDCLTPAGQKLTFPVCCNTTLYRNHLNVLQVTLTCTVKLSRYRHAGDKDERAYIS